MKHFKVMIVVGLVATILFNYCLIVTASTMHVVRPQESLWKISQRYNTTISKIKSANNHWSNKIFPGDRLVIPSQSETHYRVKSGENLFGIANKFDVSLNKLRSANKIWTNDIYPGQLLTIPKKTSKPNSLSNRELNLLARLVHSEARGENFLGKVGVASVILNRVENHNFPNDIPGVVYQSAAFEPVANGQIHLKPDTKAYKAVEAALKGWDPTGNALYFYNPAKVSPYNWIWTRNTIKKIGNHIFAI